MKPKTAVQITGLAALVLVAAIQSVNGASQEVIVLVWLGILAVAAPRAFEGILDRWGGE